MSILTNTIRRTSLQELEHHIARSTHCVSHDDRDVNVTCIDLGNTTSNVTLVQFQFVDCFTVLLRSGCHDCVVVTRDCTKCFRHILVFGVNVTGVQFFVRAHTSDIVHNDEVWTTLEFQFVLFQVRTKIVWRWAVHVLDLKVTLLVSHVYNCCRNFFVSYQNFRLVDASNNGVVTFGDQVFVQLEREINPVVALEVHAIRPVLHRNRLAATGVSREDDEVTTVPATATDFVHSFPTSGNRQSSIS
ncbi:hypothetical protein D3C75_599110 [compost metagenome]